MTAGYWIALVVFIIAIVLFYLSSKSAKSGSYTGGNANAPLKYDKDIHVPWYKTRPGVWGIILTLAAIAIYFVERWER